MRNYL